ncbi:peptidoglycan-binding domain-containing protein [Rhodovulum sp. YEN HP10]|uniref:peptidoglycan-binding domain-containing protein n=1 Tax=Rhodovulum sp. HP10 TaxID=3387397 RepID=UPI0039E05D26
MNRPAIAFAPTAIPGALLAAPYRADLLETGFQRLRPDERRAVQAELCEVGLYAARIDGAFGPATEAALVQGADYLVWSTRGAMRVDLASPRGVAVYLRELAQVRIAH